MVDKYWPMNQLMNKMLKYKLSPLLLIQLLYFIIKACEDASSVNYYGTCISKTCRTGKIAKLNQFSEDNLIYQIELMVINKTTNYKVTIAYPDQYQDQLVSDPKCVEWRVYQLFTNQTQQNARKYIKYPASIPTWPVSNYSYNQSFGMAQINFFISQNDLSERACNMTQTPINAIWKCSFEFAFIISSQTQLSHFLDISVVLDHILGDMQTTNFEIQKKRTILVKNCPQGDNDCTIQVSINSSLKFCKDSTCFNYSFIPYETLYVNQIFYLRHSIENINFQSNWLISKVQIEYLSDKLKLTLTPDKLIIISTQPGFNIYQLIVPIVSSNTLITASGSLLQKNKRILTDGQNIVQAQINTGPVSQKQSSDFMMPTNAPQEGNSNSFGINLCLGYIIFMMIN